MSTEQADGSNLTLSDLLAAPLLAAAQSNQELAMATCQFLEQVWLQPASEADAASAPAISAACALSTVAEPAAMRKARLLNIDIGAMAGASAGESLAVKAPLAALMQPSQLTVHGLEIDFSVELKDVVSSQTGTGLPTLYGALSANSRNARPSDQGGKYEIRMHAQQAPITEGMTRLLQIFTAAIEPIQVLPEKKP